MKAEIEGVKVKIPEVSKERLKLLNRLTPKARLSYITTEGDEGVAEAHMFVPLEQ